MPVEEIKCICFVRDWDGPGPFAEKRRFERRPKSEGLWVRAQFRDNDLIEGMLPGNLLDVPRAGFLIVPPDPYANNQRIYLPRAALKDLRVLGVVGGAKAKQEIPASQIRLFE